VNRHRARSLSVVASLAGLVAAGALVALGEPARAGDAKALDWKAAAAKVDALVAAKFKSHPDLVVAPRSDDAEFLRRVTLDLTGVIPTEAETVRFLQDGSPDKRPALVDALLASPRHAEYMATWYSNLLLGTAIRDRNVNRRTFNEWMRDQFARNRPYDEIVRDLITASGNSDDSGAVGLMSSFERSASNAAGKTARMFLGVQIQCAQCHDHPYDKRIKQTDFGSFAAFFMTTTYRRNQVQGDPNISFDVMTYEKEDLQNPGRARARTGGPSAMVRPGAPLVLNPDQRGGFGQIPDAKFLLGRTVKDVAGVNRREILARWLTSKQNEWFSNALVNRMWGTFLGHGIVHPVDDFNNVNKPTNPELLDYLAQEFVKGSFDLNHLIRVIVNSEAYQRSSKNPRDVERPDPSLFAAGAIKPLSVEQSFDSFFRATGSEREFNRQMAGRGMGANAGMGRGGLIDPRMAIYQLFRRVFDDDEQAESEEFTGTIPRGLLMLNGPQINQMVAARNGSPLRTILDSERSDGERVRRVYLTALSREPSPAEKSNAIQHVHTSRTENEGYEDLLWALLNTTEFMSNH
jgi:hypothetical protein